MTTLIITGGAGRIGTALRPLLRSDYRIRLLDVREPAVALETGEEFQLLDVEDLSKVEAAFDGGDAVLHLAGNPSTAGTWSSVLKNNIDATNSVFEAARRRGIGKVIFASTNHVMGFYNLEQAWPIDTTAPIRPDSLYGVSKAFGEALARFYSDAFGMSMICLRIGWFTDRGPTIANLNPLWISDRDMAQIVRLCLQTNRKFGIYNATSNNPQRHWDLTSAREELGYAPVDDVTKVGSDADVGTYCDPKAGVLAGQRQS
jgi:nucleoside-diphosphate-sugar epimerase